VALVDVKADTAEAAATAAWARVDPSANRAIKNTDRAAEKNGWSQVTLITYVTSPNERRDVRAEVRQANGAWNVLLFDVEQAVGEKRWAQIFLVQEQLLPKGFVKESFAGKKANPLDAARIAAINKFVEDGMKALGVPGVAWGAVQDGKVVFAGGTGARELGKAGAVDGDTLFMVASNTKAMSTLLLAKLVDQKKLTWDTPVTQVLPSFKLGDPETTKKVLVRHLVCACTGLPSQDFEWQLEFKALTAEKAIATLGAMQPTSGFGELFQYSNPMAAAGGYVGAHALYPKLGLGPAYDEAMKKEIWGPLGMSATTLDFAKALKGNHAAPHAPDLDGKIGPALMDWNYSIVPMRPAGGAWSSVKDMLKFVQLELSEGLLPDGKRLVSSEALLTRRAPNVKIGQEDSYGMGLGTVTSYGVSLVHHGGGLVGFHSDMLWLPEHGVGAVILTNSDPGWVLRDAFRRKFLEVLFDGRPEADGEVAVKAETFKKSLAAERKTLTLPADPTAAGKLAPRYRNDALGELKTRTDNGRTLFDFGEWSSEVASKQNPDGSVSFITAAPGIAGSSGYELVVGKGDKRTLVLRDAQHEYVFTEQ
jgi:CubicO group peptidase (beta-lactamase class C family)